MYFTCTLRPYFPTVYMLICGFYRPIYRHMPRLFYFGCIMSVLQDLAIFMQFGLHLDGILDYRTSP